MPLSFNKLDNLIFVKDNKSGENFLILTITLRGGTTLGNRREGSTKHMTDREFQARRDKGLCFKCVGRYYVGHRCKVKEQRELRALVVQENGKEIKIIEGDDQHGKK